MTNDPVTEARTAAAEHRKIARLRLAAMFQS
jgi:2-oxo-4-hydroxy-4-carboxy--5-ureidoimidazoline (OHCU) decarboxylase